jgi:FlgD Ig-like domain
MMKRSSLLMVFKYSARIFKEGGLQFDSLVEQGKVFIMDLRMLSVFLIAVLLSPLLGQNHSTGTSKLVLPVFEDVSPNSSNLGSFYFTTFASKDKITLRWKVETEKQLRGFKILRSEEGKVNYLLISSYESNPRLARQDLVGDDSRGCFTDLAVVPGTTYWYKVICIDINNKTTEHGPVSASVPIQRYQPESAISLSPNIFRFEPIRDPTRSASTFQLDLPNYFESNQPTKILIYDSKGVPLKTIFKGSMEAGSYQLSWKGDTENGNTVNEGVFIAVFENDVIREATKLILLK